MAFDVQQGFLEEGQPLDFMLLALVKHLLHALHVLRGAFVQLVQRLLILLFSLRQRSENTLTAETSLENKNNGNNLHDFIIISVFLICIQSDLKCIYHYKI